MWGKGMKVPSAIRKRMLKFSEFVDVAKNVVSTSENISGKDTVLQMLSKIDYDFANGRFDESYKIDIGIKNRIANTIISEEKSTSINQSRLIRLRRK